MKIKKNAMPIIIVLCIGAIGLVLGLVPFLTSGSDSEILQIDTISTNIKSSSTNQELPLEVTVAIEVTNTDRRKLNLKDVHSKVSSIVQTLDYDLITAEEGLSYVKSTIANEIGIGEDAITIQNLFITDLKAGYQLQDRNAGLVKPGPAKQRQENILKGIFPNMK